MQELTGKRFGRLTVLSYGGLTENKRHRWLCKCDCGIVKHVREIHLISGATLSCGCLNRECKGNESHGMCYHPLYRVWFNMIQRCTNKNKESFKNYGGRGITVCEDWLDPTNFLNWAKDKWFEGSNIDRVDNNGGYSPHNCAFITPELNRHNQRPRSNVTGYTGLATKFGRFTSAIFSKQPPCNGKYVYLGTFSTKEEAVTARNNFIITHNLPNKIQVIEL